MKPFDYIRTAFRNIMRQKLRSVLTIFAIVIGSASVTIMLTIVFSAVHHESGSELASVSASKILSKYLPEGVNSQETSLISWGAESNSASGRLLTISKE